MIELHLFDSNSDDGFLLPSWLYQEAISITHDRSYVQRDQSAFKMTCFFKLTVFSLCLLWRVTFIEGHRQAVEKEEVAIVNSLIASELFLKGEIQFAVEIICQSVHE